MRAETQSRWSQDWSTDALDAKTENKSRKSQEEKKSAFKRVFFALVHHAATQVAFSSQTSKNFQATDGFMSRAFHCVIMQTKS